MHFTHKQFWSQSAWACQLCALEQVNYSLKPQLTQCIVGNINTCASQAEEKGEGVSAQSVVVLYFISCINYY